jgi:endonuclease/exonuclease/phosphatase family metal-dependent hydrolase
VPRRLPGALDAPDIVAQAAELGLHAAYVPSMRNGRLTEDRGNAVLASVPLADPVAIELPLEHQRRVAVGAALRLAGRSGVGTLRVVSAHLTTRTGPRRLWLAAAGARARQATALAEALREDAPVVLGGDFNTWLGDGEPALQLLASGIGPARRTDRRPTFAGRYRLDHVFARLPDGLDLRMRRLDHAYGSDHFPLAGVLAE